jgi:hypothetical protein
MTDTPARTYRFGVAAAPGVLLGLPLRQAVPVIGGIVWLAACLQTPLSVPGGLVGLVIAVVVAFGRWRGAPIADTFVPAWVHVDATQQQPQLTFGSIETNDGQVWFT